MNQLLRKTESALEYAYEWSVFHAAWLCCPDVRQGSEKYDQFAFRAHTVFINLGKLGLLLLLGLLTGLYIPVLVVSAAVIPLRMVASGSHANTNLMCSVLTLSVYGTATALGLLLPQSTILLGSGFAACLLLYFFFAPARSRHEMLSSAAMKNRRMAALGVVVLLGTAAFLLSSNGFFTSANLLLAGCLAHGATLSPPAMQAVERSAKPDVSEHYSFRFTFTEPRISRGRVLRMASATAAFAFAISVLCWQPFYGKMPQTPAGILEKRREAKW